jgi:formylmethanofuran dehydrogenase subunit E
VDELELAVKEGVHMSMKIDHAVGMARTLGALDYSGNPHLYTEEVDHIRSAKLEIALQNLEGVHRHICPRQVLGARMALFAGEYLNLELPREDKRLYVFVETDGCALDGIAVTSGTNVGKRTMRVMDYGKVAATFVDTTHDTAVRIAPNAGIRILAESLAPEAPNRWSAQLQGYQLMAAKTLLSTQDVDLTFDLKEIISRPGVRVNCEICFEEIINEREIEQAGKVLCIACAGDGYYQPVSLGESESLYSPV